jgi:hypothetical protein
LRLYDNIRKVQTNDCCYHAKPYAFKHLKPFLVRERFGANYTGFLLNVNQALMARQEKRQKKKAGNVSIPCFA